MRSVEPCSSRAPSQLPSPQARRVRQRRGECQASGSSRSLPPRMRVAVAIGALAVAEPVPNGFLPAPQTLTTVTGDTAQIAMCAFEGIGSQLGVVEGRDLERRGCVTHVTPALGLGEAKLTCMSVAMTAGALAGGAAVGRTATAQAILFGRSVTAVTCSFGVRARERPSAVVDAWGVPPALGVAVRASASSASPSANCSPCGFS